MPRIPDSDSSDLSDAPLSSDPASSDKIDNELAASEPDYSQDDEEDVSNEEYNDEEEEDEDDDDDDDGHEEDDDEDNDEEERGVNHDEEHEGYEEPFEDDEEDDEDIHAAEPEDDESEVAVPPAGSRRPRRRAVASAQPVRKPRVVLKVSTRSSQNENPAPKPKIEITKTGRGASRRHVRAIPSDDEEAEEEDDDSAVDDSTAMEVDMDEDLGYDDQTSGMSTPDITRMTARQRARYVSAEPEEFLSLPDTGPKRKQLTEEERALKRAELARRRKNLSEKRLEEEKQDTLDRLLKKRAPRARRGQNDETSGLDDDSSVPEKKSRLIGPHPAMSSWASKREGMIYSVSAAWPKVGL
jgi:Ino eighty subunit 2